MLHSVSHMRSCLILPSSQFDVAGTLAILTCACDFEVWVSIVINELPRKLV